jgi:hypothetical protein
VAYYRCYFLDNAKRIKAVEELECEQDGDALIKANAILIDMKNYPFAELWNGSRVVGELRKP